MRAANATWRATTFLVHTPDAVLSRVIRPICGFSWGYRVEEGSVHRDALTVADAGDWSAILPDVRTRFATWTFESLPPADG